MSQALQVPEMPVAAAERGDCFDARWRTTLRTASSRESLRRMREARKPIALSGLAAALAWLIARDVAGHAVPFFAPVAAVIVVGLTGGQRATRALELVVGQALGILCADLLVAQIGSGGAQIGLVVVLAMMAAVRSAPALCWRSRLRSPGCSWTPCTARDRDWRARASSAR
jgi:hypothetical protein